MRLHQICVFLRQDQVTEHSSVIFWPPRCEISKFSVETSFIENLLLLVAFKIGSKHCFTELTQLEFLSSLFPNHRPSRNGCGQEKATAPLPTCQYQLQPYRNQPLVNFYFVPHTYIWGENAIR